MVIWYRTVLQCVRGLLVEGGPVGKLELVLGGALSLGLECASGLLMWLGALDEYGVSECMSKVCSGMEIVVMGAMLHMIPSIFTRKRRSDIDLNEHAECKELG